MGDAMSGRAVVAVLALAVAGCGPTAAQVRERELCYERAEAGAQLRVDLECPGLFSTCVASTDILAELRREQEACP